MSLPVYPSTLPGILQSGYTLKTQQNILRTQMMDGYTRQRIINSGKPSSLSVSISMSGAEYAKFTKWLNENVDGGAAWFQLPMLSSDSANGAPQYHTVRIQNGEISAALQWRSGTETRWKITLNLDVATEPIPV